MEEKKMLIEELGLVLSSIDLNESSEDKNITVLTRIKPSSFEFVLEKAIKYLSVDDSHAEWIEHNVSILGGDYRSALMCSRCHILNFDLTHDDYCRHCGAKMEG